MRISFRKPFDVLLDWLDEKGRIYQTAIFLGGRNDEQVLVRKSGLM